MTIWRGRRRTAVTIPTIRSYFGSEIATRTPHELARRPDAPRDHRGERALVDEEHPDGQGDHEDADNHGDEVEADAPSPVARAKPAVATSASETTEATTVPASDQAASVSSAPKRRNQRNP